MEAADWDKVQNSQWDVDSGGDIADTIKKKL